ncbi:MAG: response regulator transcription factor [Clostridia bacterium]|nr:response regulator transcription factor [Clostridia bacterium]
MLIYIAEDDENIREIECYALKNSGYETEGFCDGAELMDALSQNIPDLVILDIMMPGEDGLSILKKIRNSDNLKNIPVMMITAKTTEMDKVKGLDTGADDYITKPFGVMEFVSRVRALLRRTSRQESENTLEYKNIKIDDKKHRVTVDNAECVLTFKEYELLKLLLSNQGIVLSREKIMNKVWGFEYEGESRTVDMHIKTLRQKLGDSGSEIKTIRNVGYKIG